MGKKNYPSLISRKTLSDSAGAKHIGIPVLNDAMNKDMLDFTRAFGSVGQWDGGEITDAGSETINVSAGYGFIKATDSDTAELISFDWAESLAIAITTNSTKFIGIKYDSGTPVVDSRDDQDWDYDTEFPLGSVINLGGTLYILNNPWWVTDGITNLIEKSQGLGGYLARDNFVGGLTLGVTATRYPTMTAGTVWGRTNEFLMKKIDLSGPVASSHSAVFDVNNGSGKGTITASSGTPYTNMHGGQRVTISGTGDNNGVYRIDSVTGDNVITMEGVIAGTDGTEASTVITGTFNTYWFESDGTVHETTSLTQYPITQWNDIANNQLDTIGNNRYAVWWVFLNITSNELAFMYPYATYKKSALAEAEDLPSHYPADWSLEGIIIGRIIIQQGTADPVQVQSAFITQFTAAQATSHNNLGDLQGGAASEYYHLASADYTEITNWLDNVVLSTDGTITTIAAATFAQLVLTPRPAALSAVEGGIFYDSDDKSVYVCTEGA